MMRLYLTTDVEPFDPSGWYTCYVWGSRPQRNDTGEWWHDTTGFDQGEDEDPRCTVGESEHIFAGYFREDRLAALGFPPPGKLRVIEIGEYEEGE